MNGLKDETLQPIIMGIALERKMDVDKVEEVIHAYYSNIATMVEGDIPVEVKMDYFGKLRAKKNFLEYKKKQVEAGKVPFSILQKVL